MSTLPIDAASAGMANLTAAQNDVNKALGRMLGQPGKTALSPTPAITPTSRANEAGQIEAADAAKIVGNRRDSDNDGDTEGLSDIDAAKASAAYSRAKVLEQSSLSSIMIGRQSSADQTLALLSASVKFAR